MEGVRRGGKTIKGNGRGRRGQPEIYISVHARTLYHETGVPLHGKEHWKQHKKT